MKSLRPWSLAAMLLLSAGCAPRPDWIQSTLVTTDVTGTWRGAAGSPYAVTLTLVLTQQGPKVTGRVVSVRGAGALEGSVEGDVFRFASTFGSLKGEATVAGDEMAGQVTGEMFGTRGRLFLRRSEALVPDAQEER